MFIVFEGIDGSGKTTQIKRFHDRLQSDVSQIMMTCEPTSNHFGRLIRKIFKGEIQADQHSIAALFLTDRLQHILDPEEGMQQALKQGKYVLSDRYYLSSYAYHGAHVDMDWVIDINAKARELMKPDLHIYLDMPPEKAMLRLQKTRQNLEIYETQENLQKVYDNYAIAIHKLVDEENIMSFNADQDENTLAEQIWQSISPKLAY